MKTKVYCLTFYNERGLLATRPRVFSTYEEALKCLEHYKNRFPGHTLQKIPLDPSGPEYID